MATKKEQPQVTFSINDPDPEGDSDKLHPERATDGSAGYDLKAAEPFWLYPGEVKLVATGVYLQFPDNSSCGLVLPRSGLAINSQVTVINSPGLIDPDYTGEIKVGLTMGQARKPLVFEKYDRIAQLVLVNVADIALVQGGVSKQTSRGSGGFGSTGV